MTPLLQLDEAPAKAGQALQIRDWIFGLKKIKKYLEDLYQIRSHNHIFPVNQGGVISTLKNLFSREIERVIGSQIIMIVYSTFVLFWQEGR